MIFQKQAEDWKNQITGITVNGIAYEKGQNSYSLEENQWYVEPYQNVVKFNCTAMEKGAPVRHDDPEWMSLPVADLANSVLNKEQ